LIYQFIFRIFEKGQKMVLNSAELASIYHFPLSSTDTPRVKWLKSKEAPPPSDLPTAGTLIGESNFRSENKKIYVTGDDRRRHIYLVGQTGTGKSTLLANMIIEDIVHGKGVAMIDPHGDLVETVLGRVPRERINDVIVFDPGDLEKPLGMNMLDYNPARPEERTFIVNEMQSIFNKLFTAETMGPMFEQYMRNALLLLMEDAANEPATLIEVPRVFTDVEFRLRKLSRIHNPVVIDFWQKEAVKAGGEASLANMTPYITSKFNNFISNDYMRPIIGQAHSAFNFRKVMDEGKILLVNLSKGRIGDINAGLLGMVITGKILMAALSRVDTTDSERKDFALYIDEFQNFTTDSIATILSEARKYGLSLTMAHQFIAQLTEKIRDAVFGNVGTQIVFRVGAQDAEFLVKQFAPVFSENDLINIDNYQAYAKLLIKGQTSKPFNMRTMSLAPGDRMLADTIKQNSRTQYGKERLLIEEEIYKRLRD
ncbi:MAG: type IV secretory system conjugative DNA transfer family protein, partial [Patescibacteria group bacterium]